MIDDGVQEGPLETNGYGMNSGKEPVHESLSPAVTAARLVLLRQVQRVLRNGLTLLGISSPEKM
jgi:hypothetical protein